MSVRVHRLVLTGGHDGQEFLAVPPNVYLVDFLGRPVEWDADAAPGRSDERSLHGLSQKREGFRHSVRTEPI